MAEVIFCDNHILLLSKPSGMLTQPNETDAPSLEAFGKTWIKQHFQKPGNVFLHAVHRLDKPVSGMVLFARTSKALSRLNSSLRQNLFQKEYTAYVEGTLRQTEGLLEHYLNKESFITQIVDKNTPGAKKCLLQYKVLRADNKGTLLRITLLTGRYHQIRAQLAAIGHPIIGDHKYGSSIPSDHLFLHHNKLSFPHPVSNETLIFEVVPYWCP